MKLTVPTWLTLLRILLIPVLVAVFYLPYRWTNFAAAAVFILAAVTDWLDGWIARRYHQYSAFGAFLDPVADKLMVAVALFLIVQGHPTPWMAFWASVIVGREIAVSALREWMAELGQRATVKVAMIGKIKTVAQMVALSCLLYSINPRHPLQPGTEIWMGAPVFHIGDWLLAAAAVLTLWSGFQYLHAAWPALREDEQAAAARAKEEKRRAGG
ncbi:CDP-diacylglycerol--glycerol-3-phosphate 3-phosphatidyltransferase [Pseudoxanthomonas sp. J35]|uniref:CDP-diacylglycerol--glycerol-3-phosphate 3-phosphatidyltransferase n=1 Tax=Pseudoxanthomonas sp. J35 TaxID=935852 RepID=UPI00048E8B54|nr:CDP-diacylglycerol--glycerol-3-phosphate 3-phosphatidyltransferase [Pseudoxanthomonas sp. J35]